MAKAKYPAPLTLEGATDYDGEINDPVWLVKLIKSTGGLAWDDLKNATTVKKSTGRRRGEGDWALAYVAFVVSECVDVQPWWEKHSPLELWQACGFTTKPSESLTSDRFEELEDLGPAFVAAAAKLIQHCRKHEPRIGQYIHVDSCEAETHAALIHDDDYCPCHGAISAHGKRDRARQPYRRPTQEVTEERQKHADDPVDEIDGKPVLGKASMMLLEDGRIRLKSGKHSYLCRDDTAGARAYTGPRGAVKFWNGFYNCKAIDHFTGAPVAVLVTAANVQEYNSYPDLLETMNFTLGQDPLAVVGDKGYAVSKVFERNTERGVATVTYFRKRNQSDGNHDYVTHDRHGIGRCKHCGAPTSFVRFSEKPYPCLWLRCNRGTIVGKCDKPFRQSCNVDPRLLQPLPQTDIVYHELLASHGRYERVHHHWRTRYLVGGDSVANRPKRIGRACQQLRANAALFIEWARVAWLHGWLGSARKNKHEPQRTDYEAGSNRRKKLLAVRAKFGLHLPYGPKAAVLGIGDPDPPSRR